MKKIVLILTVVLLTLLVFQSCKKEYSFEQQNNAEIPDANLQCDKTFDIADIRTINSIERELVSDFLSKNSSINKVAFEKGDIFEVPEVVTYTNLPGKSIVLKYKNGNNKTHYEKSLIIVVDNKNKIITSYEHEKFDNGKTYIVKTFKEGIEWFIAEVDKDTDKLINFSFNKNVKMSFWECAEMAVSSCVNDGECAFICGIIWEYCLGAIGLACAYVAI